MKLLKAELAKLEKALALVEAVLPWANEVERAAIARVEASHKQKRVTMASALRRDQARWDLAEAARTVEKLQTARHALREVLPR